MKVALLWPNFEPTNASGVRARSFARHLTAFGAEVTVLTHPDPQARLDAPARVEPVRLLLHPRHWPALLGGTRALARRLRALAPDVAVCSTPAATFAWQASRAALRAGVPYVADVRDLQTMNARAVHGERARHAVTEAMERALYRDAAAVTVVTETMRARLLSAFPDVDARRTHVVPNGAEPVPRPTVALRRDVDVLHLGDLPDAGRRGEDLLRAYAEVLRSRPQTRFTFVGWRENPYTTRLLRAAPEPVRRALDLHGPVPSAEVPAWTLRAKVGVVPVDAADTFRAMLPAKAYEYVEAHLPVAALGAPGDSELRRFVEGNDVGVFATDAAELGERLLALLVSERERARLADNARRVAPRFHRERAAERLWKDVLVPLAGARR